MPHYILETLTESTDLLCLLFEYIEIKHLWPFSFCVAAILDLRKVTIGHNQANITRKNHVKNEYDVINNNGDIAQNVENRQ